MHLELRAATAEDTRSIGEAMAPLLAAGDAIALTGELGAGKTTFAQGLVRGLGFEGNVVSPTFTLVREYRSGRLPVVHADVYRLERVQDLYDLGLEERGDRGVTVVEWGDLVEQAVPAEHLVIRIEPGAADTERVLELSCHGPRWRGRQDALERAVSEQAGA